MNRRTFLQSAVIASMLAILPAEVAGRQVKTLPPPLDHGLIAVPPRQECEHFFDPVGSTYIVDGKFVSGPTLCMKCHRPIEDIMKEILASYGSA